jgi:TonB family protein
MSTQRSFLSWMISVCLHVGVAVILTYTGYKMAFPEGDVTDSISFETVDGSAAPAAPLAPPPPPPKVEKKVNEPVVKKSEPKKKAPKVKAPPVVMDQESEVVKEETKEDAQEEQAKEETEEAPPVIPTKLPEKQHVAETPPAPPTPQPEAEEASEDSAAKDQAGSGQEDIPAYGTPGTNVDKNKLEGRPGNRKPRYPWMARLRRQQGTVTLLAYVKKDGSIDRIAVLRSSGFALLDESALDAFKSYKYRPGVEGWLEQPFTFNIKDAQQ